MVTATSNVFLKEAIARLREDKDFFIKKIGEINIKIDALRGEKSIYQQKIDDINVRIADIQVDTV